MSWAKLDDGMPSHPKCQAAGLDAFGFDAAGICYSNRYGLDGFLADAVLPAVFPVAAAKSQRLAKKLVEVGRWHRDDERGGYVIHNIGKYQLESQASAERRAEVAAARSAAGKKGAAARWQTDGNEDGNLPEGAMASADGPVPDPSPTRPDPSPAVTNLLFSLVHRKDATERDPRVIEALQLMADEGLGKRRKPPTSRVGYWFTCLKSALRDHLEHLDELAATFPDYEPLDLMVLAEGGDY
jgi:hypothetical protein